MSRKFKVGDKVRAITNYYGVTNLDNNYIGEIKNISTDEKYISVRTVSCIDLLHYHYFTDLSTEHFELIEENKQMQEKQFHELEEGKQYRLLHGGEKDHGYVYELRDGRLYNKIKGKFSSVPFNTKVRFVESKTEKFRLDTLEFDVVLGPRQAQIGCQQVSREDLLEFARRVR